MAEDVKARIRAIARRRRVPKSEEKAAYETGRVESNFTNPAGGDADSEGWRQERKSLYKNPRNLDASINRFFDETAKVDHGQPSYEIAAEVQRPAAQYRGRYKDASREAQSLLKGGGGGSPSAPVHGQASAAPSAAPDTRRAALQAYVLAQGTQDQPDSLLNLAHGLSEKQPTAPTVPDAKAAIRTKRAASAGGAQSAVNWAISKVGQPGSTEVGGANHGRLADYANSRFNMSGQPWCAMFTSMAVTKGGAPNSARTPSVSEVRRKALAGEGYEKGLVAHPKPGDLVLFGDQHVGMVKSVDGDTIHYVGGNQSNSVTEASTSRGAVDVVRPKYGKGG